MKEISSSATARATISALFLVLGVFLVVFAFLAAGLRSATPSAGILNPNGPTVSWAGMAPGGASLDEGTCVVGVNCTTFILKLYGSALECDGRTDLIALRCDNP